MSGWEVELDSGPERPSREAIPAKIAEADFFSEELRRRDHGITIEFRYVLNSFLAAGKAANGLLWKHHKAAFAAWESSLQARDRDVLSVLREARNLALHEDGAALSTGQEPTYVPTPGSYLHTFKFCSSDGTVQCFPAVGVCKRSLALLRLAVEAV
jgi:hypothetical protein